MEQYEKTILRPYGHGCCIRRISRYWRTPGQKTGVGHDEKEVLMAVNGD